MPKNDAPLATLEDCQTAAAELADRGAKINETLQHILKTTAVSRDHVSHAKLLRMQILISEFIFGIDQLTAAS